MKRNNANNVEVTLKDLLNAVLAAKMKVKKYESILTRMESTIRCMTDDVEKMVGLKRKLDDGDKKARDLWEHIQGRKKLVNDCSKTRRWYSSLCTEHDYGEELKELHNSLANLCQMKKMQEDVEDGKSSKVNAPVWPYTSAVGVDRTRASVQKIQHEEKETHEFAKEIGGEMKETHGGVKENGEKMKDTESDFKGTSENAQIIQEEVKETREDEEDVGDEVKDTHADVKDMQGKTTEIDGDVKPVQEKLEGSTPTGRISEVNGIVAFRPYLPPDPPKLTLGLDGPFRELKKKLLEHGMSVIVLSAPGGCGKTTLAKKLCSDSDVQGKFKENILFVSVSKTPNLKVIVQKIFQHMGHEVSQFQSNEDATNQLEQLLKEIGKKQPIFLVLDDVWNGSDLLLDKFTFQIPDYKILVTSRFTFPRFSSVYKLDALDEKDSVILFRNSACLNSGSPQNIDEDLVIKVVRACKGFPLALKVVGRSLCRQPAAIWRKRLSEWSKGSTIFEDNKELLNCLKSSLDALDNNNNIKDCYMDLGSFPEGQLIPATALIDMWVELYGLDEDGPEFIANLHQLSNLNLIDLVITRKDTSEVDGYYSDYFVMQHDLLKEMVNHLSGLDPIEQRKRVIVDISTNKFPKWWSERKPQTISAHLFSVSTDETFSSKWRNVHAPEVEVLILNFRNTNYTLPEFISTMDKVKTLIITNCGFFPAEISNFSLLGNLSSLKRVRLEQVLITSFSCGSVQYKELQKISLHKCNFDKVFDNGINVSDALPNLVEIDISYGNNLVKLLDGLCDILRLKKLSITYCQELSLLPKEIGNLVNLKVLRLSSCNNLAELPDTIGSLSQLSILDISDCVSINKLPKKIGKLQNLRKLYMTGCLSCELPKSITNLVDLKIIRHVTK